MQEFFRTFSTFLIIAGVAALLAAAAGVLRLSVRHSGRVWSKIDANKSLVQNAEAIVHRVHEDVPHRTVAVGVAGGDERGVFVAGPGSDGQEADGETVFEVGSVTKAFTGLLLAEMVTRGEVTLETTIAECVTDADLPEAVGSVTLLQLATHTSGLPRLPSGMDAFDDADGRNPYAHLTRERLLELLQKTEPGKAGSVEYSNFGMGLLGELLAIRAETTYPRLLRQRVLTPLGMTSAGFASDGVEVVQGYQGRQETPAWELAAVAGAGGLRCSAEELLRFGEAMLDPPEELREAVGLAWTVHSPAGGPEVGLAWHRAGTGEDAVWWHNGATYGSTAYLGVRPAGENRPARVVAVLYNEMSPLALVLGGGFTDQAGVRLINARLSGEEHGDGGRR